MCTTKKTITTWAMRLSVRPITASTTTRATSTSPSTTPMTMLTSTIAWCTPCVERARRAHSFTLDVVSHLTGSSPESFHNHLHAIHGAHSLIRFSLSASTCSSQSVLSTSSISNCSLSSTTRSSWKACASPPTWRVRTPTTSPLPSHIVQAKNGTCTRIRCIYVGNLVPRKGLKFHKTRSNAIIYTPNLLYLEGCCDGIWRNQRPESICVTSTTRHFLTKMIGCAIWKQQRHPTNPTKTQNQIIKYGETRMWARVHERNRETYCVWSRHSESRETWWCQRLNKYGEIRMWIRIHKTLRVDTHTSWRRSTSTERPCRSIK